MFQANSISNRINSLFGESSYFLINDISVVEEGGLSHTVYDFGDEKIIELSDYFLSQSYLIQDNTLEEPKVYLVEIDDGEEILYETDGDFTDLLTADEIILTDNEEESFIKEYENEEEINEARKKWVIRGGKKVRKLICRKGYKAKGNRCVRISAKERRNRKIASRKLRRTMRRVSKLSSYKRKRARSMKKRRMLIR